MNDTIKAIDKASNTYLSNWRTRNPNLANPIQAEATKNNFKAGALWQLEESKIDNYLIAFKIYKEGDTLGLDNETLLAQFNELYIKYTK